MTTIAKHLITGLILAGGRGIRMGQVDKGLQHFRNSPLAHHVLRRLSPQVGGVIINANQNIAVYKNFGVPVWSDQIDGFAGPLAGIQTGLAHCETPYLLSVPCDCPFLPENLATRLSEALMNNNADAAIAITRTNECGINRLQRHPVFSLIKVSSLANLTDFLSIGGRKVDMWLQQHSTVDVLFEDNSSFLNINTLQDLRQFEY